MTAAPSRDGPPTLTAGPRPILMLVHSYYDEDPRVRREAEALAASGRPVDVLALRRPDDPERSTIAGVRVHRLPVRRHQGAGVGVYLAEYADFFVRAALAAARAQRSRQYALVQVHTLPDFLVFAALPLRLAGVPVILDLHEAMPEFFKVRFPGPLVGPGHAVLRLQEQLSCAGADAVVTVNEMLTERLVRLGVPARKVHLVRNSPSLVRFDPKAFAERPFMADGTLRLVYAGALSPVYELDVVLRAIARLRDLRPGLPVTLECYGRDFGEVALEQVAADLGIGDRLRLHGRLPLDEMPSAMAGADIGVASTRRSPMTEFSLSTKLFEYAAMGKPVIASRLPMVERTFPPDEVVRYTPGDAEGLAAAVLGLVDDPAGRTARVGRTAERVRALAWEVEGARYVALVESLARDGGSKGRWSTGPGVV